MSIPLNTGQTATAILAFFTLGYPLLYPGVDILVSTELGFGLGALSAAFYLGMAMLKNPQGVVIVEPEESAHDPMYVLNNAKKNPGDAEKRSLGGNLYEVVFRGKTTARLTQEELEIA